MKKIIWFTRMAPADIDSAGLILQYRQLEILCKHYDVTVISHKEDYGTNPLKKMGIKAIKAKSIEHAVDYVQTNLYDIAVFNWWDVAHMYIQKIRNFVDKIIVNTIDVEYIRKQRAVDIGYNEKSDQKSELRTYSWADLLWFVTKEDQKAVLCNLPEIKSEVIPIPVKRKYRDTAKINNNYIYFIGNYLHSPNVDAARILCRDIFPLLSKNIELFIIGKWPPKELHQYNGERIHITNIVYELDKYLRQMSICIAPLRYGAGLKGKVVEAMSYGIPVVGTNIAFEGLNIKNLENAVLADTSQQFADKINMLYQDKLLKDQIGNNGQQLVGELSKEKLEPLLLNSIEGLFND